MTSCILPPTTRILLQLTTSMHAAYKWLFGHWLLKSGEQATDCPVFEDYLNSPLNTAPADLLTDIYMPLKSAD